MQAINNTANVNFVFPLQEMYKTEYISHLIFEIVQLPPVLSPAHLSKLKEIIEKFLVHGLAVDIFCWK